MFLVVLLIFFCFQFHPPHFYFPQKASSRITLPRPRKKKNHLDFATFSLVDGDVVAVHEDIGQPLLEIAFALLLLHKERHQGGILAAIFGHGVGAAPLDVHGHPVEGVVLQGLRPHAGSHVVVHAHGLPLLYFARLLRAAFHGPARIWRKLHTINHGTNFYGYIRGLRSHTNVTVTVDGQPDHVRLKQEFISARFGHPKLRFEHLW